MIFPGGRYKDSKQAEESITQTFQRPLIICPAAFDLDPDFQPDLAVKQFFHILSGLGRYLLELFTSFTNQHRLLAEFVDNDRRVYAAQLAFLLKLLNLHGNRVRDFIPEKAEYLFPQQ